MANYFTYNLLNGSNEVDVPLNVYERQTTEHSFLFMKDGVRAALVAVVLKANPNFVELASDKVIQTDYKGMAKVKLTPSFDNLFSSPANVSGILSPGMFVTTNTDTLDENVVKTVVFTFRDGGMAVPLGTSVSFQSNTAFAELADTVTKETDVNGMIQLPLTALVGGAQTVTAIINGQAVTASFTVTAQAEYTMEVTNSQLTLNASKSIIFSIKNNGVSPGANVDVTFNANPAYTELADAVTQTTDIYGQVTLTLTPVQAGSQPVTAAINGLTATTNFMVNAISVTADASTLDKAVTTNVVFTVTNAGTPVDGATVEIAATTDVVELANGNITKTTNSTGGLLQPITPVYNTTNNSVALSVTVTI